MLLDYIHFFSKCFAERHCRKIKAGNIPWCPQVSRCINRILYWKGLLSRIQGSQISSSVLHARAKKAGIIHSQASLAIPIENLQSNIAAAYHTFSRIKKEPLRRDTWIANLIAAQADHSKKSKKLIWKQLCLMEQARNTARAVRAALHDQWRNPGLSAVIGPARNGTG